MPQTSIYTIGYGTRNQDEFIEMLKINKIDYLVDVRSKPYSKFKPEFSKEQLQYALQAQRIKYVFMGDSLGGQPKDPDCYIDGKIDYTICKTKPFFQKGLNRLETAWQQNLSIALMCSEGKPQECHRCKLIGESLKEIGISIQHIDENGCLKSHDEVLSLLTGGQLSLLGTTSFTSRKKYTPPSNNERYVSDGYF